MHIGCLRALFFYILSYVYFYLTTVLFTYFKSNLYFVYHIGRS